MATRTSSVKSKLALLALMVAVLVGGLVWWNGTSAEDELADLSGVWTLTNSVVESNMDRYVGDVYVFEINVTQHGGKLTGEGEQTLYNGKTARSRFPIVFTDATIKPDEVVIRYTIKGNRTTKGLFTLWPGSTTQTLTGSFAFAAADTKGTTEVSIARR